MRTPHLSIRFLRFLRRHQEDARLSCFKGSAAKSPRSILDGVVVCVFTRRSRCSHVADLACVWSACGVYVCE
jgi:hypothetical protein